MYCTVCDGSLTEYAVYQNGELVRFVRRCDHCQPEPRARWWVRS